MSQLTRVGAIYTLLCALPYTAFAQTNSHKSEDPFAPLLRESRPYSTRLQTDYSASIALGLGYTSDSNFMFGQYNGLYDQGVNTNASFEWSTFETGETYWQLSAKDLGLDTREATITWGKIGKFRLSAKYNSLLQQRNNTGASPYRGDSVLLLPATWVSGNETSDWAALTGSLKTFDPQLERNQYTLDINATLSPRWEFRATLEYEDKNGTADIGAAIFTDAASGDSSLLPKPVDYRSSEFDVGLLYHGRQLHFDASVSYSDFDNKDEVLRWQNAYSAFDSQVGYPSSEGGLSLEPDNNRTSARVTGQYLFSNTTQLQFDGSYGITAQDQNFLGYTVNPALLLFEGLPREDFDGEVKTGTFSTKLLIRATPKLNIQAQYKLHDREYETPRDGYRYVRGDGADQPRSALSVYNTSHDYLSQTAGVKLTYRLPWRSKLSFEFEFEDTQRKNSAVEETQEGRYTFSYRLRAWENLSAKLELHIAERAADTYQWDQSYFATLDAQLINATPVTQRFQNHPQMSQFHLANRERRAVTLDLAYIPDMNWGLNLNLMLQDDDFDKTELGLTEALWRRVHISATYSASQTLSFSFYGGYDQYQSDQSSRAFRGGQEKNAFALNLPLPQASDPKQNWDLKNKDTSFSLGANLNWQPRNNFELELDYSFVDTQGEQNFQSFGGADLTATDLPAVETRSHHLQANGTWHLRETLSIAVGYQYFRYKSNDWAIQGLQPDTLGKVLTFGDRNPNEHIHYVETSVIYRWR